MAKIIKKYLRDGEKRYKMEGGVDTFSQECRNCGGTGEVPALIYTEHEERIKVEAKISLIIEFRLLAVINKENLTLREFLGSNEFIASYKKLIEAQKENASH